MTASDNIKTQFRSELGKDIVVSIVINVALTMLAETLAFHGRATIALYGMHGIAFDFLPSSCLPAFLMTWLLSMAIGKRALLYPPCAMRDLCVPLRLLARLPLLLRALAMALATTIVLPITPLAVLALLRIHAMGFDELLAIKALYAIVMAVLLTPMIVKMAIVQKI